jgi:HD-GYP domain-containing protein (c-di-GMP phosphodiesterase class II)
MENLLLRLAKLICQVLNVNSCNIILLDSSKRYSIFRSLFSLRQKYCIDKKMKISNRLEKRIIDTCSSILNRRLLGVPIIAEDLTGLIITRRLDKKGADFDLTDQKILMILAEQSVIGIRNLQLYEEQQKIVFGSIKSLVTLLDKRIPQEYTHSPYFGRLVMGIAQQMRLDSQQMQALQYASMLHDAGKVDIPLQILTKTSKLTPHELNIIKGHPLKGVQILRPLQILRPAIPIILQHHERYDGKGYPSKLKGEQITIGARIMAVADAFEAMVYGRPYKERMNINSAISEIKKKNGTQFDPQVVEAFLKAIKVSKIKKYLKLLK